MYTDSGTHWLNTSGITYGMRERLTLTLALNGGTVQQAAGSATSRSAGMR